MNSIQKISEYFRNFRDMWKRLIDEPQSVIAVCPYFLKYFLYSIVIQIQKI